MDDEELMKLLKDVAETAYCNAKGYEYPSDLQPLSPHDAFDRIKSRDQERDQQIALAAQLESIDKVFELSPKGLFQNWKPIDAFHFYERLKAYEITLKQSQESH